MRLILLFMVGVVLSLSSHGQEARMSTYCNPINIDYTYMIYNAHNDLSYRSGADPAVVKFRNEYYLFVTRSMGYWHSTDLNNWTFITPEKWYFEGSNAPAAFNYKDSVVYVMGNPSGSMSVLYTDDPKRGNWRAVPSILNDLQDPCLFIDDDGQAYVYWGSSNVYPVRGRKLDRHNRFKPDEEVVPLLSLDGEEHGWERFGENHADTVLKGYVEGPWMTKHKGTYYLQYAAPGTEFNVYGDGVYTSDHPLGPFTYAPNNPVSYKPGGFMNGAGHGSTVEGPLGSFWHFGTMAISLNVNWERRICMLPAGFDTEGLMYTDSRFGDYPHFVPGIQGKQGLFAGWMLLSYNKPATGSSQSEGHEARYAVDENAKTHWLASGNRKGEWIQVDLGQVSTVFSVQVNYQDVNSGMYGKDVDLKHRYVIEGSADGVHWERLVDRSNNFKDVPNDYVELASPKRVRFVKYINIEVPTPNLAISGFRVFGIGPGKKPEPVRNFTVVRDTDRRDAHVSWQKQQGSQGYNILWGIAPDKLYSSWMVYGEDKLLLKSLSTEQTYYFSIESFNENGVSQRSQVIKVN